MKRVPALIALEDGTWFEGTAFAGEGEADGELVFNTAMTGYQEVLTDPSYHGQVVTMTYPLIGNTGICPDDMESDRPRCRALLVGECSRVPSNWRSAESLPDTLRRHGILGVDGVDPRAITLHIRTRGAMKCLVSTEDLDPVRLARRAKESPGLVGRDLASEASAPAPYDWPGPAAGLAPFSRISASGGRAFDDAPGTAEAPGRYRVAVLDCGVKYNQLRLLARLGAKIRVFPNRTRAAELLAWKPDGCFVSNGPGDPEGVPDTVSELRTILESGLPTFGICFGHQLLALALGGRTFKLKFGHRGSNQPVLDRTTGRVEITSQNHGFAVDMASLPDDRVEHTHINLNDGTSEGLRHRALPVFSVQYHPEAAPGPHDSLPLFGRFAALLDGARGRGRAVP